mgnify:CR=1 FL=1
MKEVTEIRLPEGTFFGNCRDCRYADWNDKDQYGRVHCDGGYGGYNNLEFTRADARLSSTYPKYPECKRPE